MLFSDHTSTTHSAPTAVHKIASRRINNTAVHISWEPLTLSQARGFLTNYTITLSPVSLSQEKRASIITRTVPASQAMIVVADLEPEQLYYITVAGSTSIGLGLPSEIITSAPLNQTHGTYYAHDCTMFIQLLPFRLCLQKSCFLSCRYTEYSRSTHINCTDCSSSSVSGLTHWCVCDSYLCCSSSVAGMQEKS